MLSSLYYWFAVYSTYTTPRTVSSSTVLSLNFFGLQGLISIPVVAPSDPPAPRDIHIPMKPEMILMETRQMMTLITVPAKGSTVCSPAGSARGSTIGAIMSRYLC